MSDIKISNFTDLVDRVQLGYVVNEVGLSIIFKKEYEISGNTQTILFGVPEYKDQLLIGTTTMHQKGHMLTFEPRDGNWYRFLGDYMRFDEFEMHIRKEPGYIKAYVGADMEIDYDPEITSSVVLLTDVEIAILYKELKRVRKEYKEAMRNKRAMENL